MTTCVLKRFGALLACTTLVLVLGACSSNASQAQRNLELGAATPEAVVSRIRAAAANNDMVELVASIDPASAREVAEGMTLGAAMMVAFSAFGEDPTLTERLEAELRAIVTRHGLPPMDDENSGGREAIQQAMTGMGHAGLAALVGDLAGLLSSMSDGEQGMNSEFLPPVQGELTGLTIDGDSATATIGGEAAEFVRINGRWFAKLPEPEPFQGSWESSSSDSGDVWAESVARNREGSEGAERLSVPTSGEATLDEQGRRWYRFQASQSGRLSFATRSTGQDDGDLVLRAYLDDDFADPAARSDRDADGDSANEAIELDLRPGQTVHLRVGQFGGGSGRVSFHMEASFTPDGG